MSKLECPYGSCGKCHYVGGEVALHGTCPSCGNLIGAGMVLWPHVQWFNAAEDVQFLCDTKRLELITIAVAAYYEGVLHAFLDDALRLVHPPTRMGDCCCPEIPDAIERYERKQKEASRREGLIAELFRKHRAWEKRHVRLCERIFRRSLDDLVISFYPNASQFIENRNNIHDWRNLILHRGVSLGHVWPEELQAQIPSIALKFVCDCWDVFRLLNNNLLLAVR